MKKLKLIYLFISIIFQTGKSQILEFETKSKDVLVFQFNTNNVSLAKSYEKVYNKDNTYKATIEASVNKEIFNKDKLIIILQNWTGDGMMKTSDKKYVFTNNIDTMNIICKCNQLKNSYIKNLKFKKGNFKLNIFLSKKIVYGNEIKTAKEVQNFLFKKTYVSTENTNEQNKYFKDLEFTIIDLNNTSSVRLKKLN